MATSILSAIQYTQQLVQSDALEIGSVFGLSLYNDALQDMTRELVHRGIDAAQTKESYTDLTVPSVAGYPATYAWPADMFMLKTIEVNFNDQTAQNYLQAMPVDVANIQNESFSWLRANQTQVSPMFDNRGDTFEIFPTPITGNAQGIRIFYFKTPTEAIDVGQAILYPQTIDYRALSAKMASLFYKTKTDTVMSQTFETDYQTRLNRILNILQKSSQQPIQPTRLQDTGWGY